VPASSCAPAGIACSNSSDCCSQQCESGVDGIQRCVAAGQCKGAGAVCSSAAECCSLFCDPSTFTCSIAQVCAEEGTSCIDPVECCSSQCEGGVCYASKGCATLGESCTSASCCSQVCLGGHCSFHVECHAQGDICFQDSDCCNGVCDPATLRCDTVEACVPTNEPCTGLRSCCNTLCVDINTVTGVGYCFPIGGCRTLMEICTKNEDCCSIFCGSPDALGLRRCERPDNCLPDGDVCGGLGVSQNCCNGGKLACHKTANGVSRCYPTYGEPCLATGEACQIADQCCSKVCIPSSDPTKPYTCSAGCLPLGSGTCTTDADCCTGGYCRQGVCESSGTVCSPLGGYCNTTGDCCEGFCADYTCAWWT
jgi:hypothetical protein